MTVKFVLTETDLKVLKDALKSYSKAKDVTSCLLKIIEVQCEKQKPADKE